MENFEIINKLGDGSYSTVYKVKRKIDEQIYALKKVKLMNLSEKEKLNSLNEVRILASIKSNFVISYKEAFFDEKDNTLGIIMEYADNGDLYQKIIEYKKKKIYIEEDEIWRIFIQIIKGLKSLHDLKILHRDIKSANVFLFKDGSAKLGDLNVSKVAKKGLGYTQTGTPYYASPEVWKDLAYDNKSDIWSLGCVLYEMVTLYPPFRAQNMENLFKKVIKGEINRIPDKYSQDLFSIIKLLIQVNPEKRPSCEEILKNEIIIKKIEYFKSVNNNNFDENDEEQILLKTINIPKYLTFLSNQLPKPNYNKKKLNPLNYNKTKKVLLKNYNSYTNFIELQKNKNNLQSLKVNYVNKQPHQLTEIQKINLSYPKKDNDIYILNNINPNNIKILNLKNEKIHNNILTRNNNSLNFLNSIDSLKSNENSSSNDNIKKKIFKLNNSADKLRSEEDKTMSNKEYIINNFNKDKLLLQINKNNKAQNIIKNKREMKIPIGREPLINYKNSIINKNYFPKNKINNNHILISNIINNSINNNVNKKNFKLLKISNDNYNSMKTQENNNILPLIVSYKRDNSYQCIKPINNFNNNININNKPKLKYIPKYKLKPIKNILRIHN